MSTASESLNAFKNPDTWPYWPFLPVKRCKGKGMPECSVLMADGKQLTVIHVNMYDLRGKDLTKVPQQIYSSHEEMVADGWEVD